MASPPSSNSLTTLRRNESNLPNASWSMNIDLGLCYDDTPLFRHRLDDAEKSTNEIMDQAGKSLLKQLQKLLEIGKGEQLD
jgi:hypothetical protein